MPLKYFTTINVEEKMGLIESATVLEKKTKN